jgi:membrane-associated protein
MDSLQALFELVIHLDKHLGVFINDFGSWSYLVLFLIIFCETGLVVTPFLPGDSLIFTAGAVAAITSTLQVEWLFFIFWFAAMAGDSTNYWIGYFMRVRVFDGRKIPFIKKEHLERTQLFYKRHGGKTIVLARFIPIIRTFAPFVAGVSEMTYWRFLFYSVLGSMAWIAIFIFGGYFFGNLPFIKANFAMVIVAIVLISLLPALLEIGQHLVGDKKFQTKMPENVKCNPKKNQNQP